MVSLSQFPNPHSPPYFSFFVQLVLELSFFFEGDNTTFLIGEGGVSLEGVSLERVVQESSKSDMEGIMSTKSFQLILLAEGGPSSSVGEDPMSTNSALVGLESINPFPNVSIKILQLLILKDL